MIGPSIVMGVTIFASLLWIYIICKMDVEEDEYTSLSCDNLKKSIEFRIKSQKSIKNKVRTIVETYSKYPSTNDMYEVAWEYLKEYVDKDKLMVDEL